MQDAVARVRRNAWPAGPLAWWLARVRVLVKLHVKALELVPVRIVALALALVLSPAAQAAAPAAATALGQDASERFARWLDPPVVQLAQPGLVQREAGEPVRRVLRQQHAEAVAALVALAGQPAQSAAATTALRRLARVGNARPAETLLLAEAEARQAQDATAAAALRRQALGLRQLPAALWPLANPAGQAPEALAVRSENLFGRQEPAAALAGLQAVLRDDPRDALAWLQRLWLEPDHLPAEAWAQARAAVDARADPHLQAALHQAWARQLQRAGQPAQALVAARQAFSLVAQAQALGDPRVAPRDLALAQGALARQLQAAGDGVQALALWRQSLELRSQLADADRASVLLGLDLAAARRALALLPSLPELARQQQDLASFQTYQALAERDRWTPGIDEGSWAGMAGSLVLVAGVLTLLGGLLLLALYRWRLGHWMARTARAAPPAAPIGPTRVARVQLAPLPPAAPQPDPRRSASLVLGLAGAALSAVATLLTLWLGDIGLAPLRLAVVFWAFLLGTVVVLWLLWAGARRARQWLLGGYLGGLALLSAWVGLASPTQPTVLAGAITVPAWAQPLLIWVLAAVPFLLLPLLLWRPVRAVGPVLAALVLPACLGGVLAQLASSSHAGLQAMVALQGRTGASFALLQLGVFGLGMLLALPLAALVAWGLRRAEQAGWLNDLSLVADTVWLYQTLVLCVQLAMDSGRDGLLGLLAWAAARLVMLLGGAWLHRRAKRRPARRLLLLRVFGQPRRSQRLFNSLQARWAWLGPIRMIAAPDLAGSTIGPGELVDFVTGRLRRHFIVEPAELAPRLARLQAAPDASGRFAVDDLFCGNDTWRDAVRALMGSSDLVVMDLRGFQQRHLGCRYELGELLDAVPAARCVLLVDRDTDHPLLERTLAERAMQLALQSPNLPGPVQMPLLEVGADVDAAVRQLLAYAMRVQAGAASAGPPAAGAQAGRRAA